MIHPTYSDTEAEHIEKSRAHEVLERAKQLHRKKRYELRIDDHTMILVEKRNFNRAYAEAYRAKMNKL